MLDKAFQGRCLHCFREFFIVTPPKRGFDPLRCHCAHSCAEPWHGSCGPDASGDWQEAEDLCVITARFDRIMAVEPDLVLAFSDLQADIVRELMLRGVTVFAFN
ncbi:MAG: iron complex transport system substrate-binding protein [Bryobacterales bacterium]|nr:iron complex transport system substrate-binding protein [Bryobacterales bacterium]